MGGAIEIMTAIFIYKKEGDYKCLDSNSSEALLRLYIEQIKSDGWKHVATVTAAIWMENVLNGRGFLDY